MGQNEGYTNDRLDRLAGDIRNEAASRREDNRELRNELWDQGREHRNEMWEQGRELRKEIDGLWKILIVVGIAVAIAFCIAVDAADAAPLMDSPSARHWAPTSAASIEVRTDQRLDDLNEKINEGSDQVDEDLERLRSHMKSSLEEIEDKSHDRAAVLFWLMLAFFVVLWWVGDLT